MFLPRIPAIMGAFDAKDTTPAARAHLQYWDKIVKVDSVPVAFLDEAVTYFDSHKN